MSESSENPSPDTRGYPEEEPHPGNKSRPDGNTPHEPQNVPDRKPEPSSR